MRLGIITNLIAPYRTPIFERLAELPDCDLHVVYETPTEPNRHWDASTALQFPHTILDSLTLDLRRLAPDAFLHVPRSPLAALRRFGAEVVVGSGGGIWSSPANVAALATRRKHGWSFVPWWESFQHPHPSVPRRLAEPWVRTFMRAGDAWIAWGTRATRDVVRLGADPARTVTVPQVAVPAAAIEEAPDEGSREPRILFVGQLIERKGIRVLLQAIKSVPGVSLWVAGDGPLRAEVEAAAAADPRIEYYGHLDAAGVARLYRRASALVLPSLYEVWGLVVNEALDHGIPVVVTDQVGAADDLVEDGTTGYVVAAASADELAAALRRVASWSDGERAACRRRARELLATHTFDAAADRIFEACRIAIAASTPRSGRARAGHIG
jgi:glycosyltransferase involved in cell wall biosynthesis